ncbi:hypothetical protein ACOSP7_006225 [Xanthoceras sorbifolium]
MESFDDDLDNTGILEIIWKRDYEPGPGRTLKEFVEDEFQCSDNLTSYVHGDNPTCNAWSDLDYVLLPCYVYRLHWVLCKICPREPD